MAMGIVGIISRTVIGAVLIAVMAIPAVAEAQWRHGRSSVGIYIGGPAYYRGWGPYWGPGWYGGYWGAPPVVYSAPPQPTVYVERNDVPPPVQAAAPQAQSSLAPGFWYYCREPAGYFPQVESCRGAWEQVAPRAQ